MSTIPRYDLSVFNEGMAMICAFESDQPSRNECRAAYPKKVSAKTKTFWTVFDFIMIMFDQTFFIILNGNQI